MKQMLSLTAAFVWPEGPSVPRSTPSVSLFISSLVSLLLSTLVFLMFSPSSYFLLSDLSVCPAIPSFNPPCCSFFCPCVLSSSTYSLVNFSFQSFIFLPTVCPLLSFLFFVLHSLLSFSIFPPLHPSPPVYAATGRECQHSSCLCFPFLLIILHSSSPLYTFSLPSYPATVKLFIATLLFSIFPPSNTSEHLRIPHF